VVRPSHRATWPGLTCCSARGRSRTQLRKSNALGATIDVAYTNGFAVGDLVILEKANGTLRTRRSPRLPGHTNIVFGFNIPQTLPGDQIYKMSTPVKLWVGVFTNRVYSGEAIFVGNRGRPVQVLVNGTSACSLDAITARSSSREKDKPTFSAGVACLVPCFGHASGIVRQFRGGGRSPFIPPPPLPAFRARMP